MVTCAYINKIQLFGGEIVDMTNSNIHGMYWRFLIMDDPKVNIFIVRDTDMTMMIEAKNYSRNVQKAEIDKFYNDINNPANSDVQCALFVSLNTGICNREDFQFEIVDNKPVLFIHNLISNFDSIPLASRFFKMVLDAKNVDFKNKETKDAFKNAASTIKRNFQKQKTLLDRYYNQQMELINGQVTNIEYLYGILKQKI